jgi:hypothetical protein
LSKILWENVVPLLNLIDDANALCTLGDAFFPLIPRIVDEIVRVATAMGDAKPLGQALRCCADAGALKTTKVRVREPIISF